MGAGCSGGEEVLPGNHQHQPVVREQNGEANVSIGHEDDQVLSIESERTLGDSARRSEADHSNGTATTTVSNPLVQPVVEKTVSNTSPHSPEAPPPLESTVSPGNTSVAARNIEVILERARSGVAMDASAAFGSGTQQLLQSSESVVGPNSNKLTDDVSVRLDWLVQSSKSGSSRFESFCPQNKSRGSSQRHLRSSTYFGDSGHQDRCVTSANSSSVAAFLDA